MHVHSAVDEKFSNPKVTQKGEPRAVVPFTGLKTLWINTGTLCNLSCANCYIESSPTNDSLAYMSSKTAYGFMSEASRYLSATEIGFTGGEPFMNPDFLGMLEDALDFGFHVLILTNGMRPMLRLKDKFLSLQRQFSDRISVRISLDHYQEAKHEEVRGPKSWAPVMEGLSWLNQNNFNISVAGRLMWGEDEQAMRTGYGELFTNIGLNIDIADPMQLVLFPEMDETVDVPEITENCWDILGKTPESVMCASARMVVQRKNETQGKVVACTLLPHDPRFELGTTLKESFHLVPLNHKHCAKFCVLGGASCSQ